MKIAKESLVIAAIGVADLVTTIVFIKHHGAQEANPLFRHYWEMGLAAFIIAKLICLLGPLLVLEWARKRNPRFVAGALRTAIVGYLGFYIAGYMQLNGPRAAAAEVAPRSVPVYAMYQMRNNQARYLHMMRIVNRKGYRDQCCTAPALWLRREQRPGMWRFVAPTLPQTGMFGAPRPQFASFQNIAD